MCTNPKEERECVYVCLQTNGSTKKTEKKWNERQGTQYPSAYLLVKCSSIAVGAGARTHTHLHARAFGCFIYTLVLVCWACSACRIHAHDRTEPRWAKPGLGNWNWICRHRQCRFKFFTLNRTPCTLKMRAHRVCDRRRYSQCIKDIFDWES